jgi:predicted RNase H-like HicB family nuclease
MKVTANAQRSGEWWAIEVPEVPGIFTQAKRLDQVPAIVADAVALVEDVDEADVEVSIEVTLPAELEHQLETSRKDRAESERLAVQAAEGVRIVTASLAAQQYSLRDIGMIIGVSHQRVAQLLNPVGPRTIAEHGRAAQRAAEALSRKGRAANKSAEVKRASAKNSRTVARSATSGKYVVKKAAAKAPSRTVVSKSARKP